MGNDVFMGGFTAKDIKPVLFRIQPSSRYDGIGVFAVRDIGKGTLLCDAEKIDEEFIPWEEFDKIDPVTQRVINDFCARDKDGFYALLDMNYLPALSHMNHSCDGNVGCDESSNFVAIKDIRKGQELCFDYALVVSDLRYRLTCMCGSGNCRKVITGDDWKDPDFRKKNYRYMSALQRELVDTVFGQSRSGKHKNL